MQLHSFSENLGVRWLQRESAAADPATPQRAHDAVAGARVELAAGGAAAAQQIKALLSDNLAGWSALKASSLALQPVTGGTTNVLYKVTPHSYVADTPFPPVVCRVFGPGSELWIDRAREARVVAELQDKLPGLGMPRTLFRFRNGRVEEFVTHMRPLRADELAESSLAGRIACKLASLHRLPVEAAGAEPDVWGTLERWHALASEVSFPDDPHKQRLLDVLDLHGTFEGEMASVRALCDRTESPVVFCHNDLGCGNIMQAKDRDVDVPLRFLDFECAAYNHRGFDLGNHFNEYLDGEGTLARYPGVDAQRHFIRHYLAATEDADAPDGMRWGPEPTEAQLMRLENEANAFALASHLQWALWGVLQQAHGHVEADFLAFACSRLQCLRALRPHVVEMLDRDLPDAAAPAPKLVRTDDLD